MLTRDAVDETVQNAQRDRCYECYRPKDKCFCDAIPVIHNRTNVLIVQHNRERFHPFNTARIVSKALDNSTLLVDHTQALAVMTLPLHPRAGLLFPGPEATLISEVPPEKRPDQLVILDGTWHQAKTLYRDIPALHALPRYRLAPETPGRYRIRREPDAMSLSTLEATVAALSELEPETDGLDQLLEAFETMISRQLAHPKSEAGIRRNLRRRQLGANIPKALVGDLANVVVAYGESTPGERGVKSGPRAPIFWIAERLGTGESFTAALQSTTPLSDILLEHLELTKQDFASALSHEEFRAAWADYLHPDDTLVCYHQSTVDLLCCIGGKNVKSLVLKSISLTSEQVNGTLDQRLAAEGLTSAAATAPGRAGRRLAQAITLVRHYNALGNRISEND